MQEKLGTQGPLSHSSGGCFSSSQFSAQAVLIDLSSLDITDLLGFTNKDLTFNFSTLYFLSTFSQYPTILSITLGLLSFLTLNTHS